MNLKIAIYILGAILLSTFVSCLGNSNESEFIYLPDAEITSFSIQNDSIDTSLSAVKFSIDQVNNLIYNRDSANYGLALTEKVIVTYSTAGGTNFLNITDGDSVWVKSGDSIDLAKPVILRSYALTGDTKEYLVTFNIHTVDPDSICWKQVNSNPDFLNQDETKTVALKDTFFCFTKLQLPSISGFPNTIILYISSDKAENWGEPITVNLPPDAILSQIQPFGENQLFVCTSSGDLYEANMSDNFTDWTKVTSEYPVKNVFGTIAKINVLALAVEKDNSTVSAMYDENNWEYGDKLPDPFPVQNFSSLSYTRNKGQLTIAGEDSGTAWSTTDGLYWAQMGNLPSNMQGANVFMYDDMFYLLNGMNGSDYNTSVYTSVDQSVTWQLSPAKVNLPANYKFRTGASVVVSDNMIYIIGGKNENNPVTDIWRGRLNKLN